MLQESRLNEIVCDVSNDCWGVVAAFGIAGIIEIFCNSVVSKQAVVVACAANESIRSAILPMWITLGTLRSIYPIQLVA